MIRTIVRFRNSLLENKLKPEVYHLDPSKSDNEQFDLLRYNYMYGASEGKWDLLLCDCTGEMSHSSLTFV